MAASRTNPRPVGPLNDKLRGLAHDPAVQQFRDTCEAERGDPGLMVINTFKWRHPDGTFRFVQMAMRGLSAREHADALNQMESAGGGGTIAGAQSMEKFYLRHAVIAWRKSVEPHSQEGEDDHGKRIMEPIFDNEAGCWKAFSMETLDKEFSPGIAQAAAHEATMLSGIDEAGSNVELVDRAFA